jgi:hypothetical protein
MPPLISCVVGRASSPGAVARRCVGHAADLPSLRRREIFDLRISHGDLVDAARDVGHEASWKDWNVVRYARDGDFILVTNNANDFRRLYAAQFLHAGLIIMIPTVGRTLQRRLFQAVLDELAVVDEPVNRILDVDLEGDNATFILYDLFSGKA